MEKGPARAPVVKTYPSAVEWQLEDGEQVWRPDGLAALAFPILGLGVGFVATGFYLVVGVVMAVAGAVLLWSRYGPACERNPIFRGGRDTYIRLSSPRDLARMGVSQGGALATGYGLAGVLVLLFVRNEPAWGVGLLVSAVVAFVFTVLVFRQVQGGADSAG